MDQQPARIWRSLDELQRTPQWEAMVGREFPDGASEWRDGMHRRDFLRLMAASMALASAAGCEYKPRPKLVPYVNPPEEVLPGKGMYFASTMPFNGFGYGVLVESHEGRPTKIEGNPDHPASLGGTNVFMQASVLDLYDPDRSRVVTLGGQSSTWASFFDRLNVRLNEKAAVGGAGVALLTGRVTSPTLLSQLDAFAKRFPKGQWFEHEPTDGGQWPVYSLDKAQVILSFDEFLHGQPMSLRDARAFIDGRRVRRDRLAMNRLYVIESTPTLAGSMADHRLLIAPSRMARLAELIADQIGEQKGVDVSGLGEWEKQWLAAAVDDLKKAGPAAVVIAGPWQTAAVQDAARRINQALGAVGKTVAYPKAIKHGKPLRELVAAMDAGQVDTLLILDSNPAYTAPVDLDFANRLTALSTAHEGDRLAYFTAHLGLYADETAFRCQWHLPLSHYLESWGDLQTVAGDASLVQPLIAPLYASHSAIEVMEAVIGSAHREGYEIVRNHWQGRAGQISDEKFEQWWEKSLRVGVISHSPGTPGESQGEGSSASTTEPSPQPSPGTPGEGARPLTAEGRGASLEVLFRPDPCVWDGRFNNNAWLQELPKPFTKLTWDNAALISPALAKEQGLVDGDVVRLSYRGRSLEAPVMVQPGQEARTVTLHLGYGRELGGELGYSRTEMKQRGFNAYLLQTSDAPWGGAGLTLEKTGRHYELVATRSHHGMDPVEMPAGVERPAPTATPSTSDADLELHNRRIVRVATLKQLQDDHEVIRKIGGEEGERREAGRKPLTLYPAADQEWDYSGKQKWGMSIDMTACIGCNACVVACQAENNIPVVGKEQVKVQREMHWLRIDDYYAGSADQPSIHHQPVPCMHCENAPCELVCPVGATTHSPEGINEMTYNRCVGTRYCSNNCPYKVRRFNFFNYQDTNPMAQMQRNPDVTVRSRGVMEKCNYCVQRVNRTTMEREKARVELEDLARRAGSEEERAKLLREAEQRQSAMLDDLQTACQQACPTQAIIFGDLNDLQSRGGKGSLVRELKQQPTDYGLLSELTTKPRTTYLARLTNPNPALERGGAS